MKQRTAANRMSGGGARAGATPAKTSAPPPAGSEMKRDDDDRDGRSGRTPFRARSRAFGDYFAAAYRNTIARCRSPMLRACGGSGWAHPDGIGKAPRSRLPSSA